MARFVFTKLCLDVIKEPQKLGLEQEKIEQKEKIARKSMKDQSAYDKRFFHIKTKCPATSHHSHPIHQPLPLGRRKG